MSTQRETSSVEILESVPSAILQRSPNRLLASLSSDDYQRIMPHLKRVPMRARHLIYKEGAPIEAVYFPGGGACGLVKATREGYTPEIAIVGSEGAIGANVLFGLSHAPYDVVVQMTGPWLDVLPLQAFIREMERGGSLYDRIVRHSQTLTMQIMQAAVCNCVHSAEQRCARWLLAAQDRAEQDEFPLTHDFIATMLAVRRPTITLVLGHLQAAGIIDHRRGRMTILDRRGLEAASCECYRAMAGMVERLVERFSGADAFAERT